MSIYKFKDLLYIKGRIGWQSLSKDEYLNDGNYYLVTGVDIKNDNLIDWNQCYFVSKERYDKDENIQLKIADIILTKDGTIGKIGYIDKLDKPATLNSHLFLIRNLNTDILNTRYLFWLLQSNLFKKYADGNTNGSNIPGFTQKSMYDFEIDLPDILIQEKIALFLDNINTQILRNNEMVQKLQDLGNTIYSKNIKETTSFFTMNEDKIKTGKQDANFATPNGQYKFFTCSENSFLCDDYEFEGKSILIAGNGNFNVKFYDGKFNAYQRTYIINDDEIFGNLYYTYNYNTQSFLKGANGSIIKFMTIGMLKDIQIPLFSKEINSLLNNIVLKISTIKQNTDKLNNLKQQLLPILINGQIEI